MKKKLRIWAGVIMLLVSVAHATAQVDADRMKRDIEVAENVLATLIRNEVNENRFFGLEVRGYYQEGYGVTFRIPTDYSLPFALTKIQGTAQTYVYTDDMAPVISIQRAEEERQRTPRAESPSKNQNSVDLREKTEEKRRLKLDSARDEYNKRLIKASKDFILDYGDFISQLQPNERIVVTNQAENRSWYFKESKRTHISIEATKSDIAALRQGKISRDQALSRVKVVNTEFIDVKEPDLELMASIIGRLYRSDLSTTFFSSESNIYYERLKDYGVIFHMPVYSSNEQDFKTWSMPTQGLQGLSQEERDKKVVELMPKFEQDLKENIIEYGRTVKSLKDEEVLVFDVTMTKCAGCGIPSNLEISVKANVLKDYASGKIDKNSAIARMMVKKGPKQ
jgi:hypothetical protein